MAKANLLIIRIPGCPRSTKSIEIRAFDGSADMHLMPRISADYGDHSLFPMPLVRSVPVLTRALVGVIGLGLPLDATSGRASPCAPANSLQGGAAKPSRVC